MTTEQGEATLRIHIIDGNVIVKNAKGQLLMEGVAEKGLWAALWRQLHNRVDVSYRATAKDFA